MDTAQGTDLTDLIFPTEDQSSPISTHTTEDILAEKYESIFRHGIRASEATDFYVLHALWSSSSQLSRILRSAAILLTISVVGNPACAKCVKNLPRTGSGKVSQPKTVMQARFPFLMSRMQSGGWQRVLICKKRRSSDLHRKPELPFLEPNQSVAASVVTMITDAGSAAPVLFFCLPQLPAIAATATQAATETRISQHHHFLYGGIFFCSAGFTAV